MKIYTKSKQIHFKRAHNLEKYILIIREAQKIKLKRKKRLDIHTDSSDS